MVCDGIFAQANYYRIHSGKGNLWTNGVNLFLIWLYLNMEVDDGSESI